MIPGREYIKTNALFVLLTALLVIVGMYVKLMANGPLYLVGLTVLIGSVAYVAAVVFIPEPVKEKFESQPDLPRSEVMEFAKGARVTSLAEAQAFMAQLANFAEKTPNDKNAQLTAADTREFSKWLFSSGSKMQERGLMVKALMKPQPEGADNPMNVIDELTGKWAVESSRTGPRADRVRLLMRYVAQVRTEESVSDTTEEHGKDSPQPDNESIPETFCSVTEW